MRSFVDRAVRLLVEIYAPDRVLLFGSVNKKNTDANSDIDLLVVGSFELSAGQRDHAIASHFERFPVSFDLLFYTPSELEEALAQPYSFISTISSSWLIVYEKRVDDTGEFGSLLSSPSWRHLG